MRISDWISDVCSSDLRQGTRSRPSPDRTQQRGDSLRSFLPARDGEGGAVRAGLPSDAGAVFTARSEEHTSELQSLMRISYAVFCLKKNTTQYTIQIHNRDIMKKQISSITKPN